MSEVFDKMKTDKPITLQDLRGEINTLKIEISQLKMRIEVLELIDENNKDNSDIEEENLKLFEDTEFQLGETSQEYLNIIEQTISRQYVLKIKIIISQEFAFETLALVDIAAYRTIIREGLIPTKYYEKTTQALSTTNDQKFKIKYKLSNAVVY